MRPESTPFALTQQPRETQRPQSSSRFATTQELDRVLDVISTVSARLELDPEGRRAA
jgi:hypothetical protein